MTSEKVFYWFRRDLRLSDNHALSVATHQHKEITCIFIFDSNILDKLNNKQDRRVSFLFDNVMKLKEELRKKDSDLILLYGDPVEELKKLKADIVYCNEDYEPYALKRDKDVSKILELRKFKDQVIFRGDEVLKKDNTAYKVFTPYKRAWLDALNPQDIEGFKCKMNSLKSNGKYKDKIKKIEDLSFEPVDTIKGGEKEAQKLFQRFLKQISNYHTQRDIIINNNSELSPHLRFGTISIRHLVREVIHLDNEGAKVWLSELVWRDFYQMILYQFPHVVTKSFNPKYDNIKWPGKQSHLTKWIEGKTGYPIIDAAMIHFAKTGKMHNRLRMIVASFLVKDLLIDWKKGEKYFAQTLLDFDLAANNGGWQWCASTGCDAQPYFRIFNPISQSKRFDPNGTFIKSVLPELKGFSAKHIHFPADCSKEEQVKARCIIGKDYPDPLVEHDHQRILAIELFKNLK